MFGALGGGASLGTLASAAIGSANYEDILLDACAHLFGVIGRIFDSAIGKNNGELLAAATISHAAMDMAQMGGDFTQDVVAGLMAEVVIELLKKIHIDYGDAIAAAKGGEGLVKGAAGGKAGELVVISDPMGALDDGDTNGERRQSQIGIQICDVSQSGEQRCH